MNNESKALAVIKAIQDTAEERAARAARVQAIYNDQPPYKREDLEKMSYKENFQDALAKVEAQLIQEVLEGRSVVIEAAERPHHDYSPSTLQSLEACPCYQSKQSDTPHPRTVIGTISHGVTETGEDDPALADEDAEKVVECIEFFERRKQSLEEARGPAVSELQLRLVAHHDLEMARMLAEEQVARVQELRETYLPIDDLVFHDQLMPPYGVPTEYRTVNGTTAGYIDSALIDHTGAYAEIFDWKFGFWAVERAENNLQGIAYALGMFKKFPQLQTIRYFFKQPNLDYVTDATITRADIDALYLRIQVVVANARRARQAGDFKTAKPYVPACNFCAHIASCPVVTAFACRVGSKFSPLDIPPDITPSIVHSPADTKLGFQLASVVEVWAQAFRQTVTNRVLSMQGPPPPGYSLVSRAGNRKIVDVEKCRNAALRHLTIEEYEKTLKPSLTAVEKMISLKAPRGSKTDAVKQFAEELEQDGAVARGDAVAFLKATPQKPTNEQT